MSERFSKLPALSENLYRSGTPALIAAGAIQKDNAAGENLRLHEKASSAIASNCGPGSFGLLFMRRDDAAVSFFQADAFCR